MQLADDNNIQIHEFSIAKREGMALEDHGNLAIAVNPCVIQQGDKRKLAHIIGCEVGHCTTGALYGRRAEFAVINRCERQASRWYVEAVVPKRRLANYLHEWDDDYWGAADEFDVDIETIIDACDFYFGVEPASIRARLDIKKPKKERFK